MGIILTILKIIGITLLAILLLILLILLLVLLVPIRYSASGGKAAGDFEVTARVTWLLRLVSVRVGYRNTGEDRGLTKDVRVLGISLLKKKGARKEPAEAPALAEAVMPEGELTEGPLAAGNGQPIVNADFTAEPVDASGEESAGTPNDPSSEGAPASGEENAATADGQASAGSGEGGEEAGAGSAQEAPGEISPGLETETWRNLPYGAARFYSFLYPKVWPLFSRLLDSVLHFMHKAIAFLTGFWRIPWRLMMKAGETWMKLDRMRVLAQRWLNFLNAESTRQVLDLSVKRLKRMLKHILPRKLEGRLEFGSEDPSQTGMIYGAYAAMYPRVGESFTFTPSFEEKKLNGEVSLTGKIVLGYLLLQVLAIIINRNTRMVIRGFLKMKEGKR